VSCNRKKEETVNKPSRVQEIEYGDGSIYLATPTEYAFSSTDSNQWILDPGASTHITGHQSDLTNFKRRSDSKSVRIANGAIIEAIGHGVVQIGQLKLKDV
jgi:hypothetical protein